MSLSVAAAFSSLELLEFWPNSWQQCVIEGSPCSLRQQIRGVDRICCSAHQEAPCATGAATLSFSLPRLLW